MNKNFVLTCVLLLLSFGAFAQVGVGTLTPDSSAALDVTSLNRGLLIPRINLTSNTMKIGASNNATGLLIYNSGNTLVQGFFYWNGSQWRNIDNSIAAPPSISSLLCNSATLSPSYRGLSAGAAYTGVMTIPYSGGNGTSYNGSSAGTTPVIGPINGLTYTLDAAKLNIGTGNITYTVSGNITNPSNTSILPISFLSKTCNVEVGKAQADVYTSAYIGSFTDVTSGAKFTVKTLDGLYEVGFIVDVNNSLENTDLSIAWVGSGASLPIMWNGHTSYGSSSTGGGAFGFGAASFTPPNGPLIGTSPAWGDADVFAYAIPEVRKYVWSQTANSVKRIYEYDFFMAATPATYANRGNAKCYIFAKEIIVP